MSLDDIAPLESSTVDSDAVNVLSVSTCDVDEQAAMISDWAEQYQQISSGSFTGNLQQVQFGKTQVFSETVSQRVHEIGSAWPGSLVLAIVRNASEPLRWHGRLAGASEVASFCGNQEFDIVVPADSEILAVAIDNADFHDYAEAISANEALRRSSGIPQLLSSPVQHSRLVWILDTSLQIATEAPHLLWHAQTQKSLREAFYEQLIGLREDPQQATVQLNASGRCALVSAVCDYAQSQSDDVPSVADLCREFGVSRRSLQYAFEEVVGVNPVTYLRALRLNAVRRDIKTAETNIPVMEIAARWGFWHPSYFTASYKKLFGELPSTTRQRHKRYNPAL
jgi:AraC family transcriptional regulator, ethanolamine operon transcriptional activator